MDNTDFFTQVEQIVMYDSLSYFLGADGIVKFSYRDVVKLSGHSCPTVAGAYLMALYGLKALYPSGELALRGNIKVEMHDSMDHGVTGVIANVLSFITGAKQSDGFQGIGGKFTRDNLLFFDAPIDGEVRLTRLDNDKKVDIIYDISSLKLPSLNSSIMPKLLSNSSSKEEEKLFKQQWQSRVKEILLIHKEKAVKIL